MFSRFVSAIVQQLKTNIMSKSEQFKHNLAKHKRQAKNERELIKKYEKDFDGFLTKLQLNHLSK